MEKKYVFSKQNQVDTLQEKFFFLIEMGTCDLQGFSEINLNCYW